MKKSTKIKIVEAITWVGGIMLLIAIGKYIIYG